MRSTDQASCLLKKRSGQKASRSQGLVEFAVALPILLMLLFAILDFSLLFSAWLVSQNIARQAVRYAVTGEYNTAYCSEGCEEVWDQDAARLLSIRDEAERFIPGLMVDSAATTQVDPGYLQITICSSRDITGDDVSDFVTILGRMGSAQYSECQPTQDAGGPGDTVVVMVDFNHPYLTPFLNQIWPMIHLTSAHRGVVEQFRVSRLINLPPQILLPSATPTITFTPSKTSTPTKTFTPTDTFTPSNTGTATFTPTITKTRTPTNTRTITNTPTITRTPTLNCSQFSLGDFSLT
ncbi:MAG: TadE/TadG family type IV pilus assembly protein, partial [Chloroflexota bacterium]